ncbi:hypothetical protein B7494_g6694 [Chlorociboria aeruginascens]|nr:hypothetical protein B7494_g6694 [Chlorociboria aeruginascens]
MGDLQIIRFSVSGIGVRAETASPELEAQLVQSRLRITPSEYNRSVSFGERIHMRSQHIRFDEGSTGSSEPSSRPRYLSSSLHTRYPQPYTYPASKYQNSSLSASKPKYHSYVSGSSSHRKLMLTVHLRFIRPLYGVPFYLLSNLTSKIG